MPTLTQTVKQFDTAARKALVEEVRAILLEMRSYDERIVSDWRKKPSFRVTMFYNRRKIIGLLEASQGQVFSWIDIGTGQYGPKKRPYFIFPKKAPRLKFQTGYLPKTRPVARFGVGPGKAFGPWVSTDFVLHPGIKSRDFTKDYWDKTVRPVYSKRLQQAIQRIR